MRSGSMPPVSLRMAPDILKGSLMTNAPSICPRAARILQTAISDRIRRFRLLVGCLGLCLPMFAAGAQGKDRVCEKNSEQAAVQYVLDMKKEADAILDTHQAPLAPLKVHVLANVEFDPLARFALGRFWNQASAAQRTTYRRLFKQTVSHTLASEVLQFRGGRLEIVRQQILAPDDILVRSRIVSANGEASDIGWRIGFRDCRPLAVDVLKGGISMITTKRQEFEAVASRQGVEGLLVTLRTLAARQRQKTSSVAEPNPDLGIILNQLLREAAKTRRL